MADVEASTLDYAWRGWRVLPLHAPTDDGCSCRGESCTPGKHPRTLRGFKDASTDRETIQRWWAMWPMANVGIATGTASGLLVLDVDPAHGGTESLNVLLNAHAAEIPHTVTVETGGGGLHYYFQAEGAPYPSSAGRLGSGLDVRAEGGYVVAPPSLHPSGKSYHWATGKSPDDVPLAPVPEWLASAIHGLNSTGQVQSNADGAIPCGSRNSTLLSLAGAMQRRGASVGTIATALRTENEQRCSPPLPDTEVEGIAKSVSRYSPVFDSPALDIYRPANRILRFITATEFCQSVPEEVAWIAPPWVAAGSITELAGKVKQAGKTTLLLALCRSVVDGNTFLGEPTIRGNVAYLTEQTGPSFRQALRRAGLDGRDGFLMLPWSTCSGLPWTEVMRQATRMALEHQAVLLIVDTLGQFAGIEGDSENSSGAALAAMQPLQLASAQGLAVVVARHERKSGGEPGDSARGSSAFTGAVDIVISLRRSDGGSPNVRVLRAISRFEETPSEFSIEWRDSQFHAIGATAAPSGHKARRALLDSAGDNPETAVTVDEVAAESGLSRATLNDAARKLAEDGELLKSGKGVKGDPIRWYRPLIHSPEPNT